jgi:site-specific recombinase XerD
MIKAMELRKFSQHTKRYYLSAVTGVARYYQQSPDTLTQEMIEDYLLYLRNDKGNAPGSCANVVAGLRFFYHHVADRQVSIDYSARKVTKLPIVLSQEEIWVGQCRKPIFFSQESAGVDLGILRFDIKQKKIRMASYLTSWN